MNKEWFNNLLFIGIVLAGAVVLATALRNLMALFIRRYTKRLNANPTHFSFIKNSIGFVIYTSAIVYIFFHIPQLREMGKALFAGAGILAVVVGFASQKAFANIISGVFILMFRPFKIMDIIEFTSGQKGVVEEITLRHTIIKDYENRRIIIPNSIISEETIINSNIQDEKIRKHIVFSISYDSNIDKAIEIIRDEAENHPLILDNRNEEELKINEPIVRVRVVELGEFSVDLKAYVWSNGNDDAFTLKCDLLKSVKERFDREGIEIPFPYRTLVMKKDLEQNDKTA